MARQTILHLPLTIALLTGSILFSRQTIVAAEKEPAKSPPEFWLGVVCHPLKKGEQENAGVKNGLVVEEIVQRSPAAKGGIKTGDILISCADKELRSVEDLAACVAQTREKNVSFKLVRDGREQSLKVTLSKRPAEIQLAGPLAPLQSETPMSDAEKRKQLMDAAKKAMAHLQAVKAKEDAERQEIPALAPPPDDTAVAVGKLTDGPVGGSVRHAGTTWRASPKTVDGLPQDVRDHVQTVFLRMDAGANQSQPNVNAPQEPARLSTNDTRQLEKRVEEIERKLDEVLTLLKAQSTRANKKKK